MALSLSVRLALADRALLPAALLGIVGKPAANLRSIVLQALNALGFLRREIGFDRLGILLTVALQHRLRRCFELRGLALEVRPRAAAAFGRVARQLHPVDRKHLAPDQALPIARIASTAANPRAMSSPTVLTKLAMVVKCGLVSPHKAMNATCSRHARSMARLLTIPRE